jgi:hypothetical protein
MSHKFPAPVTQNGRLYFWRSQLERHKRKLAGLPLDNGPKTPDVLVPAAQAAAEFGFGRRTLGRRIKCAEAASDVDEDAA